MKAIFTKILLFFRDLFLSLRVVVKLRIGKGKVSKESEDDSEISSKED